MMSWNSWRAITGKCVACTRRVARTETAENCQNQLAQLRERNKCTSTSYCQRLLFVRVACRLPGRAELSPIVMSKLERIEKVNNFSRRPKSKLSRGALANKQTNREGAADPPYLGSLPISFSKNKHVLRNLLD